MTPVSSSKDLACAGHLVKGMGRHRASGENQHPEIHSMASNISKRLEEVVDSLPLQEGLRILEIGCGTGSAAREIARRIPGVYVLGIDRSAKAIRQSVAGSQPEISKGQVRFLEAAIEDFVLKGEPLFDLAFAIRVGALDGRHRGVEEKAFTNIAKALKPAGRLFIDGGNPLREIDIQAYR